METWADNFSGCGVSSPGRGMTLAGRVPAEAPDSCNGQREKCTICWNFGYQVVVTVVAKKATLSAAAGHQTYSMQ
jgi:hypothetical protein